MSHDVIVVGGSFAGLSAALQLARARRRVLVIDAGKPRNRFAAASHGFLGQDGKPPRAILDEATRQLLAYPTVAFVPGEAVSARAAGGGFAVALADGREEQARRLVLATGLADELPLPGMAERWGRTVLHCPYCHGYEMRDRPLGVIAGNAHSVQQAALLPDWGPATYFTQGLFEPDAEAAALLAARGVRIERSPVVELLGNGPGLDAVRLGDGRTVAVEALFVAPKTRMASPLAGQLGCVFDDGPTGPYLRVDDWKATTVPGIHAAGDATSPMHNATLAAASGVIAAGGVHQSLVRESTARARASAGT